MTEAAGQIVRERTLVGRAAAALAILGGGLMLAVSAMVVVNVLMRWLADDSIQGAIELVQIATALSVFSFLPLCQWHRGNIMVDTFTSWLPSSVQRGLDALWDLVYAFVAVIMAWRLFVGAADAIRTNTVSMQLGLQTGWAIGACAAMAAFLAFVALAGAGRRIKGDA